MKPIFLDSGSPKGGGGGVHACGCGKSCLYLCVLPFDNTKSNKNTLFFACSIDLRRAMLLNQLGAYSSDLCQIWALEEAVEERNKSQSYPKSKVFGCMHLIGQNKQQTFRCNLLCISPATMSCTEQCCIATWGPIPHLCAKFEPQMRRLRRETSAKAIIKAWFLMHAFDWPEQTLNF